MKSKDSLQGRRWNESLVRVVDSKLLRRDLFPGESKLNQEAGVEAAQRAGLGVVGIGKPDILKEADAVIAGLYQIVALARITASCPNRKANL